MLVKWCFFYVLQPWSKVKRAYICIFMYICCLMFKGGKKVWSSQRRHNITEILATHNFSNLIAKHL